MLMYQVDDRRLHSAWPPTLLPHDLPFLDRRLQTHPAAAAEFLPSSSRRNLLAGPPGLGTIIRHYLSCLVLLHKMIHVFILFSWTWIVSYCLFESFIFLMICTFCRSCGWDQKSSSRYFVCYSGCHLSLFLTLDIFCLIRLGWTINIYFLFVSWIGLPGRTNI